MTDDSTNSLLEFTGTIFTFKKLAIKQLLAISSRCGTLKAKPENRPLYQFNLLDIVSTEEPHTSKFLCAILNYTENGKHIVVESFIDHFLAKVGLSKSRVIAPDIEAEKSHIDVLIRDNDYAIIIENKLMNAPFQRNQLGRYIETVHNLGYEYENIYIVLLPQYFNPNLIDDIRPSVWKCPPDGLSEPNATRFCSHSDQFQCWCDDNGQILGTSEKTYCSSCTDFHSDFQNRTSIIHSQLTDWLLEIGDIINPKQTILRSGIHQFADFIKGLFDIRVNQNLIMDIQKLITDNIIPANASSSEQWNILDDKLQELSEIQGAINAMKLQLSKDLIDEWYHDLKRSFKSIHREVQKSFGIQINGVWVGCWCGSSNNGSPYWGFYCENQGTEGQRKMVTEILDECDMRISKSTANYICWDSTRNGAEICRNFYKAAIKLGYL